MNMNAKKRLTMTIATLMMSLTAQHPHAQETSPTSEVTENSDAATPDVNLSEAKAIAIAEKNLYLRLQKVSASADPWSALSYDEAKKYMRENDHKNFWSPPFYWTQDKRYAHNFSLWSRPDAGQHRGTYYVAHRGMVDLHAGIAENTIDAIQNAAANHVYLVELDIQATKDDVPILLHDDSLFRTYGHDIKIKDITYADLLKVVPYDTYIQQPDEKKFRAIDRFCADVGTNIGSLDGIVGFMNGDPKYGARKSVTGGLGPCMARPGITYFLDPKNLKSGAAAIKYIKDKAANKRQFTVKAYPAFWNPAEKPNGLDPTKVGSYLCNKIGSCVADINVTVMPVIDIRSIIDKSDKNGVPNIDGAIDFALKIIASYGKYFNVKAVEFPGAWDPKWDAFSRRFQKAIIAKRDRDPTFLPANPDVANTGKPYLPIISYGYRFPDFTIGSAPYTWNMAGRSKRDGANAGRRTLGAQYPHADNGTCLGNGGYGDEGQLGCFVTTDFPMQEFWSNYRKGEANIVGAPQTNLPPNTPFAAPKSLIKKLGTLSSDGNDENPEETENPEEPENPEKP